MDDAALDTKLGIGSNARVECDLIRLSESYASDIICQLIRIFAYDAINVMIILSVYLDCQSVGDAIISKKYQGFPQIFLFFLLSRDLLGFLDGNASDLSKSFGLFVNDSQ